VVAFLIIVYFVLKFGLAYAESKLGRPSLVREFSDPGFKQRMIKFFKSMFNSEDDEPVDPLAEIILSPEMQETMRLLVDDVRQARSLGLPYQNWILYGPPGTGKTDFMKLVANAAGLPYAVISGADILQFKNGEGVIKMNETFGWANRSENGVVICIDESELCFKDRALLPEATAMIANTWISYTGSSSNKYMFIFTTNFVDMLDAAVRSRFHKIIGFLLPALAERYKILMLKVNKYIVEDKRVYYKDGEKIEGSLTMDAELNEEYWRSVATRMEGFSGRDIDQAVGEMRIRAYRSGMNVLTKDIVEFVVKDKIATVAKNKKIAEYQRKQFEKTTGLVREADPQALEQAVIAPAAVVPTVPLNNVEPVAA